MRSVWTFSRTRIATGHEVSATPLTIAIAILCFAIAGHRLPQLARELAADERRKPDPGDDAGGRDRAAQLIHCMLSAVTSQLPSRWRSRV